MNSETTKQDVCASVTDNRQVAPGFWQMTLRAEPMPVFEPGQFFQLQVHTEGTAPLLRRPFAPSQILETGLAFVYAVVGEGTEAMTRLEVGATVRILAPLGKGYELPPAGNRAVLVGGGCGTPSLRMLGAELIRRNIEVYSVIGSRTACTLLEREALDEISTMLALATDDGSEGIQGHAVSAAEILLDEIEAEPSPWLFACGPHQMLKGLAALAEARDLSCQVSLEEKMACGFGACMGCAVPIKADNEDGFAYRRVCIDGPVFDSREVQW